MAMAHTKWNLSEALGNILVDYPYVTALTAAVGSAAAVIWLRPQLQILYETSADKLPGPLLAIVGFVLTALAIVAANGPKTVSGVLAELAPKHWHKIMRTFARTAKLCGALAVGLALVPLFPPITDSGSGAWDVVALATFAFFMILATLQVLKSILMLEYSTQIVGTGKRAGASDTATPAS